jgi:hypothetical protein
MPFICFPLCRLAIMELSWLWEFQNIILMFVIMIVIILSIWILLKKTHTDAKNPVMGRTAREIIGGFGVAIVVTIILGTLHYLIRKRSQLSTI